MKKLLPFFLCALVFLSACVKESPEPIYTPPEVAPEDRKIIRTTEVEGIGYRLYNDMTCDIVDADPEVLSAAALALPDYFEKYTIVSIEAEVFRNASLTDITLPRFLKNIGDRAFEHSQLTHVLLPDTVETIGEETFANCVQLEEITISSRLKAIPTGAFFGCTALKEVLLPDGLTEIGEEAFGDNTALEKLSIPESITKIGAYAFWHCSHAALSLSIPDSVTEIGINAFEETSWLKGQTAQWLTVGEGVLIRYNGEETSVTLPEEVRFLSNAFDQNDHVKEVTLPSSLLGVAADAFGESSVEKVHYSGENEAIRKAVENLL